MKILVTEKNGHIGYELQRSLLPLGEVIAVDAEDCDLTNIADIVSLLEKVKPGLIVNPATYNEVDKAEFEPDIAFAINATAPKILAAQANLLNIPIIHYSTDYVFDGTKSGLYVENDCPNPQSIYGKTKWQGELNVRAMCRQHVILRTGLVFGMQSGNFLKNILELSQDDYDLKIIADQFGAPTSAQFLAVSSAQIAEQILAGGMPQKAGTYHLVADGETTWYGYACKIVEIANELGVKTKVQVKDVKPISSEAYPSPVPLPKNIRLSTHKIREVFGINIPDWSVDVAQVLKQIIVKE